MSPTTIYPSIAPPVEVEVHNPYEEMLSKIASLYTDSMRVSAGLSSARIIQEHAMRALMEASRSCMEALAKNAAAVQQQSFTRPASANQKPVAIMSQAFTDAMSAGLRATPPRQVRVEWR